MLTVNSITSMTSLQIAEITNKQHQHIMRDIKDESEKLAAAGIDIQSKFGLNTRIDKIGRVVYYYNLTKSGVLQLAARYDAVTRSKLIDLAEQAQQQRQLPSNFKEALRQLIEAEEEKEQLTAERDYAIKTKAYISDTKTAKALNTASQAVRKVNKLESKLTELTDNDKREGEYTASEIASIFDLYSLQDKKHVQVVSAIAKAIKTKNIRQYYHQIAENKHVVGVYYTKAFIYEMGNALMQNNVIKSYVEKGNLIYEINNKKYKLR